MIYDFIQIDRKSSHPMNRQLYEGIRSAIISGKIRKGSRLPSVRTASAELKISKTTVESAYIRLCCEGFVESRPQSGYFALAPKIRKPSKKNNPYDAKERIKYDFSSERTEISAADLSIWRKYVRSVLNNPDVISSYGEPQGEKELREVISDYAFEARGVLSGEENIVIGAGTQILLTLFCSLFENKGAVAVASPGFKQAERIFKDFGFRIIYIDTESEISVDMQLELAGVSFYLDIPSSHQLASADFLKNNRRQLLDWVSRRPDRLILEDDYNGELKYRQRPTPALQSQDPEKVIYLGSFSKLLLPSVRIAYMVLPQRLAEEYAEKASYYNQTAGKTDQLALAEYIKDGQLEKRLRKLKKVYFEKSRLLVSELSRKLGCAETIYILESSLAVVIKLKLKSSDEKISEAILKAGIKPDYVRNGKLRLSFSGIPCEEIIPAVSALSDALAKL